MILIGPIDQPFIQSEHLISRLLEFFEIPSYMKKNLLMIKVRHADIIYRVKETCFKPSRQNILKI